MRRPAKGRTGSEVVLVAAPACAVAGILLDERGQPIADALCEVVLPEDLRARIPADFGRSSSVSFTTHSNTEGSFALDAPRLDGAQLAIHADGFRPTRYEIQAGVAFGTRVLEFAASEGTSLFGRVRDQEGVPCAGCTVSYGGTVASTDPDGLFEIALPEGEAPITNLVAFAPGKGVAEIAAPLPNGALIELRLVEPRTVAGRVVDSSGTSISDVGIWLVNPTPMGNGAQKNSVERALASRAIRLPDAVSGPDGSFSLDSLLRRPYELLAVDRSTLVRTPVVSLAAEEDELTLVLDPSAVHGVVHGRALDANGQALAGLDVGFALHAPGLEFIPRGATTKSDADGSFLLRSIPREHALLEVRGAGILPLQVPMLAGNEITLVAERAARLQVIWEGEVAADSFLVFDSNDTSLPLHHFRGAETTVAERGTLPASRSEIVSVSDRATRVVVLAADKVLAEQAVILKADQLIVVRMSD